MKLQRHIVVTVLLSVYALFMTFYYGIDLLKSGHEFRFYATLTAEVVLIILTFFALRKRDRLKNQNNRKQ